MSTQPTILTISVAPWVDSGYGHQAGIWWPRFKNLGYNVINYAYRGLIGKAIHWPDADGIRVLPQGRMTEWGLEVIPYYVQEYQPDFIVSLSDLFLFHEYAQMVAQEGWPWYHWCPVDTAPLGAPDYNILNTSGIQPIAMSVFGATQLENDGFRPLYVPHAIDAESTWFPPTSAEKKALRHAIGIKDDVFVIVMDAANEAAADRKGFFEQFQAFASFNHRHPNSMLICHTFENRHPIGLDLTSIARVTGCSDSVFFPPPSPINTGAVTFEALRNNLYWLADLATCASHAEGFGLPSVQFQACGVPIVTTNFGPMTELCAPGEFGGSKVPGQFTWSGLHSSRWMTPSIDALEDAYEQFYLAFRQDEMQPYQAAARAHALQYDIPRVERDYWIPVLQTAEAAAAAQSPSGVPDDSR